MKKLKQKVNVARATVDTHRVTQVEIRVSEYPKSGFKVLEFWVSMEDQKDSLVLKCFCDKGFQVRKISDSLVERIIEAK